MSKKTILAMLMVGCLGGMQAQNTECQITINGKVQFIGKGEMNQRISVTENHGFERVILGEVLINPDNTYSLTIKKAQPGEAYVTCCNEQRVRVWVEDEDLNIDFRGADTARVKIKNPPYVYIKGGAKNELMNLANFCAFRDYQNMIAASQVAYKLPVSDSLKQQVAMPLYQANNENTHAYLCYLVEHNAHLTSCLSLLGSLNAKTDAALIEQTLQQMEKSNPGSVAVANYRKAAAEKEIKNRKAAVGQPAPNFTLPDERGKQVSLSSLKGKVLIVDFWASWCGPCRAEMPNVKKIHEEFKNNKEVGFVSVSIDAKEADWRKALEEEQCEWLQLLAPNSGRDVMDDYQFRGIPFIICIDRESRIFRKQLRGDAVRQAILDALKVGKE